MNILFICDEIGYLSGAQKSAFDVLNNLLATNYPITILSYNKKVKLPKELLAKSNNQLKWIKAPRNIPFPKQINYQFLKNFAKWVLRGYQDLFRQNFITTINPDLVFVNSIGSHLLYLKCRFNKKVNSIMIFRGSPATFQSNYYPIFNLDYVINALRNYAGIIFVSSIVRDEWISYKELAAKKTFYIPNCSEEDIILNLRNQSRIDTRKHLGIPTDRFVVVCIANIQHGKGQDVILDNIEEIKKVAPDIIIYFIGKPLFPWGHKLVRSIKNKNYGDSLQILGFRRDALSFIYAADILILSTRAEAMPRVVLEAMALKTAVISTDVGGIPELIQNEVSGLLISPDNSEELIKAIEKMYIYKDKRKRFAEEANRRYWTRFTSDLQVKRYAEVIKEMLKN